MRFLQWLVEPNDGDCTIALGGYLDNVRLAQVIGKDVLDNRLYFAWPFGEEIGDIFVTIEEALHFSDEQSRINYNSPKKEEISAEVVLTASDEITQS